jgi:predicted alpha/beta hydrolase
MLEINHMQESLIKLHHEDGSDVALWKLSPKQDSREKHVLLTHGTFSNKKVLLTISEYLVQEGYTCWIFEWRNHGHSKRISTDFDFETIAQEDFKLVFDHLFLTLQIEKIDCITHSGGGICLTLALIHQNAIKNRINSISMFACQAFGANTSFSNYLRIVSGKYFCKIMGYIPAKTMGSEENERYALMKQWFNWNISGEFKGNSGIDYKELMKKIDIPILSIYGAGDHFIAPPQGCEQFLAAFDNSRNKLFFCSKANGFAEDYNHSRILHSRNAKREIYPEVLHWMKKASSNQDQPY